MFAHLFHNQLPHYEREERKGKAKYRREEKRGREGFQIRMEMNRMELE